MSGQPVLALVTDAYGGRGGIAQHNRHLLAALASAPGVGCVTALPRIVPDPTEVPAAAVDWRPDVAGSKRRYVAAALAEARRCHPATIVCGHLHLLPLAALAARAAGGARLVAVAHGIEAWPDPGPVGRALLRRVDTLVAVSRFTLRRIEQWAGPLGRRGTVVPNAVDLRAFTPGPKRADLAERYGLTGCRTVLIVARLAGRERYKGHEELFAALATLPADVRLLVVGDGDDRARLVAAADQAGVAGRVVWAGYIDEAEKADHYRLADVFALPGRGEGFGIVYLEALACGTPAIASTADASGEALLDGCLGAVVDPDRPAELVAALRAALDAPRPAPADLSTFSAEAFAARWHAVLAGRAVPPACPSIPPPAVRALA